MGNIYVYFIMLVLFCFMIIFPITSMILKASKEKNRKYITKEKEFKKLYEISVQTQQEIKEGQEKLISEVTLLNKRITAIEKMLREVE